MTQPIVLKTIGMVTSLGLDWATSCAAARAGILRAARLPYFRFRTTDTGELTAAVGHQVGLLGEGFQGVARLLRLLAGALKDLLRNCSDPEILKESRFYLSVPHPGRPFLGADLLLDVATRNKHLPLNQEAERISDEVIRSSATDLLDKAAHSAKWPGRPSLAASSAAGHAGVAVLLQQAQQDLIDGSSKSAIVGGIDSLLGEETLTWLLNTGRLKTPSTAAGVMPGEGAALLHLSHRQDSGQVLVRSIALRQEDSSLLRGEQPMGKALAQAVWDIAPGQPALLSSDHNGEGYRGAEFGRTLLNIQRAVPDLSYRDIYLPAQSFGDTGAATGAIAIAQLAGMWARSTFRQDFGIALASSDGPQRAAVLIERRKVS